MRTRRSQPILLTHLLGFVVLLGMLFAARDARASLQDSVLDVARLDAFVNEQVRRHRLPGLALALVADDQIVLLRGYSQADGSGRPMTAQTPFILASASKPLTALAIMQLVEAGKLELDGPVQRYLPGFRLADPVASQEITVRHLLLHTSGIPITACDTRVDAQTLEQYVAELQTVKLDAPVGVQHQYCSGNYNVLGRIIEVVSGQSFGSYMQQQVFAPLEMHHSFASEQEARRDGLTQNYRWFFGLPVPTHDRYNPSQLPSGYLVASAEDMAHFLIAQLNEGKFGDAAILSPAGIAALQAHGVAREGRRGTYGLGWVIDSVGGIPAIYHDGAHADARTLVLMEPAYHRGAVVLINSNSPLLFEFSAFKEIKEGLARLLAGQEPPPSATLSLPALYLVVDAVLGVLLALALWPLVRMWRWRQWWQRSRQQGNLPLLRVSLRLGWEFALPLTLLAGARLLLHILGAQSWGEGLQVFPDVGMWLWAFSVLVLLTGAIRLVFVLGVFWRAGYQPELAPQATPSSGVGGQSAQTQ